MPDAPATIEAATGDYEIDRQRHVRAANARSATEAERLTWPLARLHALRDDRLRALVHHAKANSPWHAQRLAHVDADSLSGDDLSDIPPMTKADLIAHWDDISCDRRLTLDLANAHLERVSRGEMNYLLGDYHVIASGGSTGVRAVIAWDFEGWLEANLGIRRAFLWIDKQLGSGPVAPSSRTAIYSANPVHISASSGRCFGPRGPQPPPLSPEMPLAEIVDELHRRQPAALAAYASMLELLAREAEAGRLRIKPLRIVSAGEPLPPDVQTRVESAFGVRPYNQWNATEATPLAFSDGVNPGLVLMEDCNVIEPVDEDGRPVPAGTRSAKVFVTNVLNGLLPLIRYEITDQVTFLDEPNPGPWTGRRIANIEGRLDDMFKYAGGVVVHPHVFRAILGVSPAISEYQVMQTANGADISVCCTPAMDGTALGAEIAAALARLGVPAAAITVAPVERIIRHAESGKLKRFIPLT